ncbi:MAG: hypothetical protein G3M70_03950 [Candidatus Nitronauta litoralis]|uniref:AFP-like domain-containing protein n=1 Tax=Candidatus Nitronauta litoralis TaxID=2705533 RepID=A0A7T0FZ16_9BACT|nr:MAG: hypothetical protein G3M70_03950 [Candidatus Nitronauta litoralis]
MNFQKEFEFLGKKIGAAETPPLIVAEIGFNHNGDVVLAEEMICLAKDCGADAVKLQTFIGTELYAKTFHAIDPDDPGSEIPFHEFWERFQLSRDDYARLFSFAKEIGIPLFSTPFDEGSLAMLMELGMGAIKIASGDLTHHELLKAAAGAGVPVVLSSGMATEEEVEKAMDVLRGAGADRVVLLHCVSNYPSRPEEMNLRVLKQLHDRFQVPVGLSDHTMEPDSSVLAAALGASIIEKHFTTDSNLPGPDQKVSLDPDGLRKLKSVLDQTAAALGDGKKVPQDSELETKKGARRSVVSKIHIDAGAKLTREMLVFKRPGTGIPAEQVETILGKPVIQNIPAESIITSEMLEL